MMVEPSLSGTLGNCSCGAWVDLQFVVAQVGPSPSVRRGSRWTLTLGRRAGSPDPQLFAQPHWYLRCSRHSLGPSMMIRCGTLGWVLSPLLDYPELSVSQIGWPYARVRLSLGVK